MRLRSLFLIVLLSILPLSALAQNSGNNDAIPIALNQFVEGEFTADHLSDTYAFEAEAGQIVSVQAGGYPALMDVALIAPDGTELGRGYPNYSPDAYIYMQTLSQGGIYQVVVRGNEAGTYEVIVRLRETPELSMNDSTQDYFYPDVAELDYTFSANAGQIVTLRATSEYIDPTMTLIAPDGDIIAEDDDSGGNLQPRLSEFVLPQTGQYRLIVRRYADRGEGTFYVRLYEDNNPNRIHFDEERTVNLLPEATPTSLLFSADAGDVVSLHITDSAEVAHIVLTNPRGDVLRDSSYESGYQMANFEDITLPVEGEYRISIRPIDDISTSGDVTVRVERIGELSLDASHQYPMPLFLSDKNPVTTFSFSSTNAGVNGTGWMRIMQVSNSYAPSMNFQIRFINEGEIVAQINYDDMLGIYQFQSEFYFPLQHTAQQIEVELVGEGTAYFTIETNAYYGEG